MTDYLRQKTSLPRRLNEMAILLEARLWDAQYEWWAHELEGCVVCDGKRQLGTVSGMLELPSCEVLEVRREDGRELLVPMVRDAVRNVDVAARCIEVSLDFLGEA